MQATNESILQRSNVITDSSFHRWGDAQRLMDLAEIVVHVMQRDGMAVIVDFLAVSRNYDATGGANRVQAVDFKL
jgi:hypothetical protein